MGGSMQKTDNIKWMIALRIVAGAPLLLFGVMHLIGAMPMKPLLVEAGLPAPDLMAIVAPLVQAIAGASLLAGAYARVGGILAIGSMGGAIVTHLKIPNDKWPDVAAYAEDPEAWAANPVYMEEPMIMMVMAIAILVLSAMIVWKGAGAFSLDHKAAGEPKNAPDPV